MVDEMQYSGYGTKKGQVNNQRVWRYIDVNKDRNWIGLDGCIGRGLTGQTAAARCNARMDGGGRDDGRMGNGILIINN